MIKSIEGYSYKVNQHIGKGYSSTVHKGFHQKSNLEVSIKVIQMSKLQDPINQMLLQYQVSALKSLTNSTNVLHLYDVYATKNNTYIITQLMQGDLHNLLKQKKQFMYYEAVQILKQIITGYFDIYKEGYLHRDIKPANVFYRKGVYKIGDFGFAIPIKDINQHKCYNVGSPVYMPPQALKQNLYSVSCDTWAIGVIFYQLLKGLVPWRAISEQKLYEKIMNQPLSELTLGLPDVARVFLSKILHLDPYQRMTPEQLITWPQKLFGVQIRQMNLSPVRAMTQKPALQQIKINQNQNRDPSRSKSYSNGNPLSFIHQASNQVQHKLQTNYQPLHFKHQNLLLSPSNAGKRLTLTKDQNNSNFQNFNNVSNPLKSNNSSGIYSNQGSKINFINDSKANSVVQDVANNNTLANQTIQHNLFTKSQVSTQTQNSQPTKKEYISSTKSPQYYAHCMLSYLKFIHRVIKFISQPTHVPLKDLQLSLTKFLFKEIQKIKKFTQIQNMTSLTNIQAWKQFILSKDGEQRFTKKIVSLKQKYKMFLILPKDQFVLEVYKQQLIDGIRKLASYLQQQKNFDQKTLISLDYLITFYQIWQLKEKSTNKSFKQFLELSKVNKIMEGNPYNVQKQHLNQLRQKIKAMGLVNTYKDVSNLTGGIIEINNNLQLNPSFIGVQKYQNKQILIPQIKINYQERGMRY